jgi:hypothetical protein
MNDEQAEREIIGWRQLLRAVNLHDFADMVRGEGIMIGTMVRRAFALLPQLPFGPVAFCAFMLLAWVRTALLAAVVIVFGGSIAVISVFRGLSRRSSDQP